MTAVLDACPDLRALTDEELAAAYGANDADLDALLAEERRRESERRAKAARLTARRARQQQWFEAAWQQHRAAETACNGVLLSKAGLATGMDPFALWSGPQSQADRYASWELQEFWQTSPRITVTEWQRQERRERGTDDHEMDRDEPGSVQPGSPAAAAGTVPGTGPVRDTGHVRSGPGGDMIATGEAPATLATPFADIESLSGEFVWQDRIPAQEISLLVGPGKIGKGVLSWDLAARISRGDALPGDIPQPPANVIVASTEEDPNVVTVNRLRAAGADMSRVFCLSIVDGEDFELPTHLPALRRLIDDIHGCRLIILDPLAGVAPISLTAVRQVRALYKPVRRVAQDSGAAVLFPHHTTKEGSVAGSAAVVDNARSVLMLSRDAQDPEIRVLTVYRTNMGLEDVPPIRYKIRTSADGYPVVEYLTGTGEQLTGEQKIMQVLTDPEREPGPVSGQEIAAKTGILYTSTRVFLKRLVDAGLASSPMRGWFTPAPVVTDGVPASESGGQPASEPVTKIVTSAAS